MSRSAGFRRRRGGVVLALGLLASGGAHAIAGCGEQLGLAEFGEPSTAPDAAAAADGSTQGGADGGVEVDKDGETDGTDQRPACHDRPLSFGTPVRLDYTVIPASSVVIHPYISADEQIFFGENVSGLNHNLVYGTRANPTDPFDLVVVNAGTALPEPDELAPAGFALNEIYFGHPTQDALFVANRQASDSTWQAQAVPGLPPGGQDRWPSLTSDGLLMVFRRFEQSNATYHLMQATRPTPSNAPWTLAPIGTMTASHGYPVVTHDGLGLFYKEGAITRFVSRPAIAEPFKLDSGTQVSIEGVLAEQVVVRSMSRDGCRLYLTRGSDSYVATRTN